MAHVFLICLALLLLSSLATGYRLFGSDELRAAMAGLTIALCFTVLGTLAGGLLGEAYGWAVPFALLGIAALELAALVRLRRSWYQNAQHAVRSSFLSHAITLGALVALLYHVLRIVLPSVITPPIDGDSLGYHLPIAVNWLQSGSFTNHVAPFWYYPSYAEILTFDLLRAGTSDTLVGLQNALPLVLLWLGIVRLGAQLGAPRWLAALVSTWALVHSSYLDWQLVSQENDILLAACVLVAASLILDAVDGASLRSWILAGAAAGVAAGTKYSGLGYAALLIVFGLVLAKGVREKASRHGLVLFFTCTVLVGAQPYVRNLVLAGSPFWPMGISFLGIQIFPGMQAQTGLFAHMDQSMIAHYLGRAETWKLLMRAFRVHLDSIPLLGILGIPMTMWHLRGRRAWAWAVLLAGCSMLMLSTPFSAENVPGTLNQLRHGAAPARYGLSLAGLLIATAVVACAWVLRHLLTWTSRIRRRLPAPTSVGRRSWSEWWAPGRIFSLWVLAILLSLFVPVLRAEEPLVVKERFRQREQIYSEIGAGLPQTKFFGWYDSKFEGKVVWVDGMRSYPLTGMDQSKEVLSIPSRECLLHSERHRDELPDLLVVAVNSYDRASPDYGKFSIVDSLVRRQPALFQLVFSDSVVHAYRTLGAFDPSVTGIVYREGWSPVEKWGRWLAAPEGGLSLESRPGRAILELVALGTPDLPGGRDIEVWNGEQRLGRWHVPGPPWYPVTFRIPVLIPPEGTCELTLRARGAPVPRDPTTRDPRSLYLPVKRIRLTHPDGSDPANH